MTEAEEELSLHILHDQKTLFCNIPYALEASDVTFQQANRPSGNTQGGNFSFLGNINCMVSRWSWLFDRTD